MAAMTAICPHVQVFTEAEIERAEKKFREKEKRSQEFAKLDEAIRKKMESKNKK